ncbi:diablo homolog, mitochondrial-like isoform X2 [Babylonia areolata]|uniref:diablo homolog, mitochondrial-like isoform X2 n=1 Tax=Babylonia areolata TaxID=304850 RepID=UPI003FD03C95
MQLNVCRFRAPDKDRLKQEHMLKAASANAAGTVATLLNWTAYSLTETEQKYRDMVTTLIQLLEYHTAVLGNPEEEERVMDIIAEAKGWLQAYQKHIEDLELLLSSVQNLADASAEVAFLAGSEFTSTSLGERVHNVSRHMEGTRAMRQEVEAQLQEVETHCTEAITKHAERAERRKKAEEDAMFDYADISEQDRAPPEEGRHEEPSETDIFAPLFEEEFAEGRAPTEEHGKENGEDTF